MKKQLESNNVLLKHSDINYPSASPSQRFLANNLFGDTIRPNLPENYLQPGSNRLDVVQNIRCKISKIEEFIHQEFEKRILRGVPSIMLTAKEIVKRVRSVEKKIWQITK